MVYSYPTDIDFTTSNGFMNLLIWLNTVTSGWFSNFMLITIFLIFGGGYYYSSRDFWGGASLGGFVTSIIAIILWIAGALSTGTLVVALAVAIISFVGLFVKATE